jgi:topoisomerase-4 subunit B
VFQFSVGLNGVGTKAVNALSVHFQVCSWREGKYKRALFSQGQKLHEKGGKQAERNGTFVEFSPDPEIFGDFEWHEEFIEYRLRYYSFLNSGLVLNYNGKKFKSREGLGDLLSEELGEEPSLYPIAHVREERLEFAFTHTNAYGENYYSFVNGQHTSDGGTHQSAFREGILKGVNEFAGKSFAGPDVRDGIVGAVAVKLQDPVFESQTKNKLGSTDIRGWIVSAVKEAVMVFLHKNPDAAAKLVDKIAANEKLRKELSAVDKHSKADDSSIFLTEGDSAGGSMVQSRDVDTQAIFALKGKPVNTYAQKRDAIYKNEQLYNIMRALGIEDSVDDLRYNKVIIATDADVDGMHIRNLLLTYFLHFFEDLVLRGHVYIFETPLFRVRNKKETRYCYSEAERDTAIENIPKAEVTRFKGLGEISPGEFKEFISDDERLEPVRIQARSEVSNALEFFMGKNTPERKSFIVENLIAESS